MSQPYVCFHGLELYFYNCNTKFIDKLDNASNLVRLTFCYSMLFVLSPDESCETSLDAMIMDG